MINFIHGIPARYIRVIPKTWLNDIAVKLELFGCHDPLLLSSTSADPSSSSATKSSSISQTSMSSPTSDFSTESTSGIRIILKTAVIYLVKHMHYAECRHCQLIKVTYI